MIVQYHVLMTRVYQTISLHMSYTSADHNTDVDFPSSVAEIRPRGISQLVTGRDHSLRERSQNGTLSRTSTYAIIIKLDHHVDHQ